MIVLKRQPPGSKLCGQACISMICNISIFDAIQAVGTGSGTNGTDLHRGLRRQGINSSERMVRVSAISLIEDFYKKIPQRCIIKVRSKGVKQSHWVLIWDGKYYDPDTWQHWEYISGYIEIKDTGIET